MSCYSSHRSAVNDDVVIRTAVRVVAVDEAERIAVTIAVDVDAADVVAE